MARSQTKFDWEPPPHRSEVVSEDSDSNDASDDNCFDDYTGRALDAILRATRVERDFLQWLVSVLAAVGEELKSSAVLSAARPGSSKYGTDHQPVGGEVRSAVSASHMTTTRMSNGVQVDTAVGTFAAETHLIASAPRWAIGHRARRIERPRRSRGTIASCAVAAAMRDATRTGGTQGSRIALRPREREETRW